MGTVRDMSLLSEFIFVLSPNLKIYIVSSEAQFETWWWPNARAETCCLSNKYTTTLLVVLTVLSCTISLYLTQRGCRCLRLYNFVHGPGSSVSIATAYRLDGPGINSRWGARFSARVQTGPEAHPASCTMGTGAFPGVRCCWGVTLTPHPLLMSSSKIE